MIGEDGQQEGDGSVPSEEPDNQERGVSSSGDVGGEYSEPGQPVPLWNNGVSIIGLGVAAGGLLLLLTFGLFSLVSPSPNPYVDIVGYLVFPGVLVLGLLIVPLGMLLRNRRLKRLDPERRAVFGLPRVNLNDPAQLRAAKFFVISTFILLPIVAVSGYHGYHYTDSVSFCAEVCHSVMEPEGTTYRRYSHARVPCAECHIGAGADWFVKSKLSGTRQVLAMWRKSYSRPIPPAIHHLRPARETCEVCHWPEKFFGAQLRRIPHFAADEANTGRAVNMLVKTGGSDQDGGRGEGIHRHMALGQVEYVATDEELQVIPWVRVVDVNGEERIYRSDGGSTLDPPPDGPTRVMDCMDCHNRPSHKVQSPQEAINARLNDGSIDRTLPYIKREAVGALVKPYADVDAAHAGIAAKISGFYRTNYPELADAQRASIEDAIEVVTEVYRGNFFPYMKVNWRTYPNNIGHLIFPGCYRCHDEHHVNQRGETLALGCDTCHSFLNEKVRDDGSSYFEEGEFAHLLKLIGVHARLRCDQCHDGGVAPLATCDGCHSIQAAFRAGTLEAFASFSIGPEPMADSVDCEECHDLDEPTTVEAIDVMCIGCHDEEPPYVGMLAAWKKEAEGLLSEAEACADAHGREILKTLRAAGPLHNMDATRAITGAISAGRLGAGEATTRKEEARLEGDHIR